VPRQVVLATAAGGCLTAREQESEARSRLPRTDGVNIVAPLVAPGITASRCAPQAGEWAGRVS